MTKGRALAFVVVMMVVAWARVSGAAPSAAPGKKSGRQRAKATKLYIKGYEHYHAFQNTEALGLFLKARKLLPKTRAHAGLRRTLLFFIGMSNSRLGKRCRALALLQRYLADYKREGGTKAARRRKAVFEIKRLKDTLKAAKRLCGPSPPVSPPPLGGKPPLRPPRPTPVVSKASRPS